ncbi:hypothetical protein ZWY2020_023286 [Hordeum vulgare]|nr:hypothetical protein ZWY2020_023286 [Hordeum vulgare]
MEQPSGSTGNVAVHGQEALRSAVVANNTVPRNRAPVVSTGEPTMSDIVGGMASGHHFLRIQSYSDRQRPSHRRVHQSDSLTIRATSPPPGFPPLYTTGLVSVLAAHWSAFGRALETEKDANVVFEVGSRRSPPRSVLASPAVFAAELRGPMKEGDVATGGVVRIQDMEAEAFKALIRFAYTGSLPETSDEEDESVTCQHLIGPADRYNMERLKLICEQKLCRYIDVDSVMIILALAEQHQCQGLKKACFNFLSTPANLRAVMATDDFKYMITTCPSIMYDLMPMSYCIWSVTQCHNLTS